MADARQQADSKAEAAKARDLAPAQSLRLQLEALRLEIRAAADLVAATLGELTVERVD